MHNLIPLNVSLNTLKNEISLGGVLYKEVYIINEFARKRVNLDYFKIDMISGRLSFEAPWNYFSEFLQRTNLSSDKHKCMEEATYDVYVHFVLKNKKGTLVFKKPKLLSSNNYGPDEGYQILLQATETELTIKEGWL